jgi:hypothetical protein
MGEKFTRGNFKGIFCIVKQNSPKIKIYLSFLLFKHALVKGKSAAVMGTSFLQSTLAARNNSAKTSYDLTRKKIKRINGYFR